MPATKTTPKGHKPDKLMRDALMLALHRAALDAEGRPSKKLSLVADAVVEAAIGGDMTAAREIFDRVDGKVKQETDINANVTVTDVEDNRPVVLGFLAEFAKSQDATQH